MSVGSWVNCAHCVYGHRVGPKRELKCGIVLPPWVAGSRAPTRYVGEDDGCSLGVTRADPYWEAYLDSAAAEARYGQS